MKSSIRAVGLLLAAFAMPAFGTTKTDPKPTSAHAGALSNAKAGAIADADGGAGGAGGTGGTASSNNSVNVTGASSGYGDDHDFYVLPSPMFAPQLPAIQSPCTNTSQRGMSAGWSALSMYEAGSNTDNCVAIEMYNAAVKTCHYATAGKIMDLLTAKVLAGFEPPKRGELIDLSPSECRVALAPVPERKTALSSSVIPLVAVTDKKDELIDGAKKEELVGPKEPKKKSGPKTQPKAQALALSTDKKPQAPVILDDQCMRSAAQACAVKK